MMVTPDTPYIEADKVILTGRLKAGKDYVAEHSGHTVYGFADPIYKLTDYFIGTSDKDVPGARRFMQKIGAWGRAQVDEDYPRTAERWRIEEEIRERGEKITGIGHDNPEVWNGFGIVEDFWIQILGMRINDAPEDRIAITNGRFPNEVTYFTEEEGFEHRHVMCSEETRKQRLEDAGEEYDPEAETDVTEQLAHKLDEMAVTPFSPDHSSAFLEKLDEMEMLRDLKGPAEKVYKLRSVVWNDDPSAMPQKFRVHSSVEVDIDQDQLLAGADSGSI